MFPGVARRLPVRPEGHIAALGSVANTDTKLLIYWLFQKGRVLAQDAGETELYDDLADPEQLNDLSDDPAHAAAVEELEATLQKLLAEAHEALLHRSG